MYTNTDTSPMSLKDNLQALMNRANLNPHSLAAETGVKQPTIFRILEGISESPRDNTIRPLANYFEVSIQELRYGDLAGGAGHQREAVDFHGDNTRPIKRPKTGIQPVWHISWVAAGTWCDAVDPFCPGDGFEQIPCPEPHSDMTIALTVDGPSMDDGTEDGYKDGEIIFVDAKVEPRHNSDVVARTPDGKVTFKRLQITSDGKYLLALNPDWPNRIIMVPEGTTICGVVIGSYKRRRR